tara:strand:- start:23 stop:745 length:723 start_codon:yes stop_codon:yes gene_type:complete
MSNTCGVDRDDPNMKEGHGVPFMIEDCFSKRDWNLPTYDNDCCKEYSNGKCRPTIQGGYCHGTDDNNKRVYYKYKDDVGNNSGRSSNRITRVQAGRESPYSTEDEKYHKSGVEDLKDLQNEFYNELMLNRIMSTEPKAVKRNLEKEELVLEELEDDELKEILEELEEEEGKSNQYLWLFISTLVLSIIFFIVHENLHVKLYRLFKKGDKKDVIKGGKKSDSKTFKFKKVGKKVGKKVKFK